MDFALLGSLVVLALIDSTSFGTLLIPVWLLLTPGRLRPGRVLLFLGTVAAFDLVVGLVLLAGAASFAGRLPAVLAHPAVAWAQLVLGVGLFVWSFFLGGKKDEPRGRGRVQRWRDRAMGADDAGAGPLVSLALGAATLEVATMLPYLGAIGLLTAADLPVPAKVLTLAGYCLVMVLPALVLLGARAGAARRVEPWLRRFSAWLERSAGEMTAWVVGIVGFLLARDALARVPGLIEFLDRL